MKKLVTACLALVALAAFVLPATASATNEPDLTNGANRVPHGVGEEIVGTATNTEFQTTAGGNLVTCSTARMAGVLTENTGGTVEGEITAAEYSGTGAKHSDNGLNECTGSFGNAYITVTSLPLCLRSDKTMATDEFQVSAGKCSGAANKVKFLIGSTTAGECEYESTNTAITGDYTTGGTQASLTVHNTQAGSGSTKIRGGFLCPSSGKLKMTFTLENGGGQKLTVS